MDRINEMLLAIRRHLALSQEEAAERLKVSVATYQRWEWGQAQPQPLNRRKILSEFGPVLRELGLLSKEDQASEAATTAAVQEAAPRTILLLPAALTRLPAPLPHSHKTVQRSQQTARSMRCSTSLKAI